MFRSAAKNLVVPAPASALESFPVEPRQFGTDDELIELQARRVKHSPTTHQSVGGGATALIVSSHRPMSLLLSRCCKTDVTTFIFDAEYDSWYEKICSAMNRQ